DLVFGDPHLQRAIVDVEEDRVAVLDQADQPAVCSLGGDVADRDTGGTAGEAAIRDQCALTTQAGALQEGGRVQHLLHARATSRAFVAAEDRKSTRLNSSHVSISYAGFC